MQDASGSLGVGQLHYIKTVLIFFFLLILESMIQHVEETDTQYGYLSDHSNLF